MSQGAFGCSISPTGWNGTSGVMPDYLTAQRTYTLTCANSNNSVSDSIIVFVNQPTPTPTPTPTLQPTTVSISVNSSSICVGQSAYLSWTTNNATQAFINQLGAVNLYFGNQAVSPSQTTTYTITATNLDGGCAVASTTVFVTGSCYIPTPTPTPTPTPNLTNLTISKDVRNLISGNYFVSNSVNAQPGDSVEFVIQVGSYGNTTANNIRLSDFLPYQLSYLSGSTTIDGLFASDGITAGSIYLGSLFNGQTKIIKFRASVRDASVFSAGNTQLTNTARATADNTGSVDDTAFVNVSKGEVLGSTTLQIQKTGRNISKGDLVEKTSMNATPSDTIEFLIRVKNLSSVVAYNVIVTDTCRRE